MRAKLIALVRTDLKMMRAKAITKAEGCLCVTQDMGNDKAAGAVTVIGLRRYDNFLQLFSSERLADTGCTDMTAEQAAQSMYKF